MGTLLPFHSKKFIIMADGPEDGLQEYLYKVLVVGDIGTGKTSIIKRFVHNIFSTNYKSTIGVDFALKVIRWDDHTEVRLQLWDIAGQERFGNMTRVYYKEAVGALIVFDVTRVGTFEAVTKWKSDIDAKVTLPPNDTPIPVVLLANKCDLPDASDFLQNREQMDRYCQDNGFIGWCETSAKDNINIDKAAKLLVQAILDSDVGKVEVPKNDTVKVENPAAGNGDKSKGCDC